MLVANDECIIKDMPCPRSWDNKMKTKGTWKHNMVFFSKLWTKELKLTIRVINYFSVKKTAQGKHKPKLLKPDQEGLIMSFTIWNLGLIHNRESSSLKNMCMHVYSFRHLIAACERNQYLWIKKHIIKYLDTCICAHFNSLFNTIATRILRDCERSKNHLW